LIKNFKGERKGVSEGVRLSGDFCDEEEASRGNGG
jgi:hypothetical protein